MSCEIRYWPDMKPSLDKIKNILKNEIGLDASTIGEATINKILNERMRSCEISELDEYYSHLCNSPDELHLLLETSVIPETWFFRDDKPFKLILNSISKQLVSHPERTCRILCIPCSTGEEPYSISIYLRDNGIPDTAYGIQAVDISYKSIEIATQAIYGKNSFRGKNAKQYAEKYFNLSNSKYSLKDDIKSSVDFQQVNILEADSLPFNEQFDFILCRNLLIYFDMPTKEIAYTNLNMLLKDNGLLFIGHSEFGSVPEDIFKTTKINSTFCLTKSNNEIIEKNNHSAKPSKNNISTLKTIKPPKVKAFSNTEQYRSEKEKKAGSVKINKSRESIPDSNQNLIQQAKSLADSGKFNEAETLCLKYIDENGDHEESFFLLGLINEASGNNSQAHSFYKKALYLNPKHYETLIHLSLIIESQGDIEASNLLKERAARVSKT